MEAGNSIFVANPDTVIQSQGTIPVENPFVFTRPSLSEIPGKLDSQTYYRKKVLDDQLKKQLWYKQIMGARKKLLREEQTLLVDSSYYIRPRNEFYLTQAENRTHQLVLPSRQIEQPASDWFTFIIVLSFMVFTSVKFTFGKYLSNLFHSIINYSAASRLFREQNISLRQGSSRLEILYLLVFALFAYQLSQHFGLEIPAEDFMLFLICILVLGLYFLLKISVYYLVGTIGETRTETNEYLFNMRNHHKILGIMLLPVVCFIAWAPDPLPLYSMVAGVVLAVVIYLFMLGRGTKILLKKQFSIFYLFLYLCTLEILPLVLFFKVI
jgi:hypothetical protein